jgi:lipoprotein NlpD
VIFKHLALQLFSLFLLLAGCSSAVNYAPVDDRERGAYQATNHYIVSAGETLYSIAWRYGIDFKMLAATNSIDYPYTIYPGQRLRLKGGSTASKSSATTAKKSTSSSASTASGTQQAQKGAAVVHAPPSLDKKRFPFRWLWPSDAKLGKRFSLYGKVHKGVDLKGNLRDSVVAANSGTVVYAGSGLVGYGKLLIVKHNDRYLSAYGHNHRLLVSEGESVKGGQKIAEMGNTGADEVKLHFEIRKDGKPVDPLKLLPKRTK